MAESDQVRPPAIALLPQYLYELRKAIRPLFLLTMSVDEVTPVLHRLERDRVASHVQWVGPQKANVFFGACAAVQTVRTLADRPLNTLSAEADFMLGALLGYDLQQQCCRYLQRRCAAEGEADRGQPLEPSVGAPELWSEASGSLH